MKININQLQLDLNAWFRSPERKAWKDNGNGLDKKVGDFYARLYPNSPEATEWSLNFCMILALLDKSEAKLKAANLPIGSQLANSMSDEANAVIHALYTLALDRDGVEQDAQAVPNVAKEKLKKQSAT
jgi:hypothetical protein